MSDLPSKLMPKPGAKNMLIVRSGNKVRLGSYRFSRNVTISIAYFILVCAVLSVILPLLWIFLTSIKEPVLAFKLPPVFIFTPTLENYFALIEKYPFHRYFYNSGVAAVSSTLIALLLGVPAAYSIARYHTGGNSLISFILLNRTLPPVALVIPLYILLQGFSLFDSYPALVIANLTFIIPFVIWTLLGFFETLPSEIEDAALVDGCTRIQLLRYVVIPIAAPGIMATAIISFMFCWNEFIFALLLTGNKARTLPIGVANFLTQQGILYGELTAATILLLLPAVILTLMARKYLVQGLSLGGIR